MTKRSGAITKTNSFSLKKLISQLGRAEIFFYSLAWLMVLLTIGTIQQKYIGLYMAQKIYFSSFIVWSADFIPVPGGYAVLGLIFINLLAKLLSEKWTKAKFGTVIVHYGALLLLLGGFFTATFSTEGNVVIVEGGSSNYVSDYHKRELVVVNLSHEDYDEVTAFGNSLLKSGKTLQAGTVPFTISVEKYCRHCEIEPRNSPSTNPKHKGMLLMSEVKTAKPFQEDEKNRSGIVINISGAGSLSDGQYALYEYMPVDQVIVVENQRYLLGLRRKRTYLPFEIELIDFQKELYPGTQKARSYQSEVIVREKDIEWHSLIYMNNPMRYKGYTFYQSSFIEDGDQQVTILAAVKNIGKIFPYISSLIICIGLLFHMFIRIPKLTKNKALRKKEEKQ